jgi:hypothetical protein
VAVTKGQAPEGSDHAASLQALSRPPGQRAELKQIEAQLAVDAPVIEHLSQVMPAADFLFGGGMLLIVVLLHATGMRWLTNRFETRAQALLRAPSAWRPDVLLGIVVAAMLMLHIVEIFVWTAALVWSGLVHNWRAAGFFAANTYTTVGYGNFVLPDGWHMLAPIIAISGLFTFGWTGSVLVEVVRRCQEVKSAAVRARGRGAAESEPPPAA